MKRRKTNLILCSLILIASLLAEIYCFLEFRKDILTILGTSVIVLVAAFITLDSFLSIFGMDEKEGNDMKSDGFRNIQKYLEEMEKVQKATFVMAKKNALRDQEIIKKIIAQMEQQREVMVKTGKLIAKYDRENSLRLEALLHKIAERPDFDDTGVLLSLGTINQSLEKLSSDFEKLAKSLETIRMTEPISLAKEVSIGSEPIMEEELIEEPIPEPEPEKAPEIDTSDPNKMMSPDDIAALLASMGGEETSEQAAPAEESIPEPEPEKAPEIDTSDPNKMMSPDDIAALLASMGGEETSEQAAPAEESIPEPEPEKAPEIDTSDPNKMMSPDDIAALLASMGGEETSEQAAPAEESIPEPEPEKALEIDTSDPNKMMSPDDIAALLASMGGEETSEQAAPAEESIPEPEPEKALEIDTSDPNKMMSPDDIAALLASMGQ